MCAGLALALAREDNDTSSAMWEPVYPDLNFRTSHSSSITNTSQQKKSTSYKAPILK